MAILGKFSPFQIAVSAAFFFFVIVGVSLFAAFGGRGSGTEVGTVVIWGTLDAQAFNETLTNLAGSDKAFQSVSYEQKNPQTYANDLIQAIASGRAPDLFLLSDDQALSFGDKVIPIPYDKLSARSFAATYIDQALLFAGKSGIVAIPIIVDPLVMYYNRDLLSSSGVAQYPTTWSEVQTIAPRLTSLDRGSNVKRSAVALGSWDNVAHAKEILVALFMQVGENIVGYDSNDTLVSTFGSISGDAVEKPAESVLRFYTNFSNPVQSVYSWNRALPNSLVAFAAGDLGLYFGRASEYNVILSRNPNLSFGVAPLPQANGAKTRVTYGRLYGLAVPRGALNPTGGQAIALRLGGVEAAPFLSKGLDLPSARRDSLTPDAGDAKEGVFAESALIARGFFDPNPNLTDSIFKRMVDSSVSGASLIPEAVRDASGELQELFLGRQAHSQSQ